MVHAALRFARCAVLTCLLPTACSGGGTSTTKAATTRGIRALSWSCAPGEGGATGEGMKGRSKRGGRVYSIAPRSKEKASRRGGQGACYAFEFPTESRGFPRLAARRRVVLAPGRTRRRAGVLG